MSIIRLTADDLFRSSQAQDFLCEEARQSYSPFFSSIGLLASPEENGIGALLFHYNRATRTVFHKLADFPAPYTPKASGFSRLTCGDGALQLSFYDTNAFLLSCRCDSPVPLFSTADETTGPLWIDAGDAAVPLLFGYSKNGDARDPDEAVPFVIALQAKKGVISVDDDALSAVPDTNGEIMFACVVALLDYDLSSVRAKLAAAPDNMEDAVRATERWAKTCVKDFDLSLPDAAQADKIRFSVMGLLFNLTLAEGQLKHHVSAFPNRGTYPTHFLWDTCFQNLAYEKFSLSLAEDLLLQNIETQRHDGKFGQFLCSTWIRPQDSQPALIGWAVLRLAKQTKNARFIKRTIPALEKNVHWWLTQRATPTGLVFTLGGLETGQDNAPRFDEGPTIAADMNAYLLNQMTCIARLAEMIDDGEKAESWDRQAAAFAAKIRAVLYSPEDGLFFDRDQRTGKQVRVASPSALLPLWAGDVLNEAEAKDCIRKHLLNPETMFGNVPFPSVAYNDPTYNAADWWRGPTWLPIAWLMLECLDRYGFTEEKTAAAMRLYQMIAADAELHELYDSKTGAGMGAPQQGWTCAIFLQLIELLFADTDVC